jgi:hypothetical protein
MTQAKGPTAQYTCTVLDKSETARTACGSYSVASAQRPQKFISLPIPIFFMTFFRFIHFCNFYSLSGRREVWKNDQK